MAGGETVEVVLVMDAVTFGACREELDAIVLKFDLDSKVVSRPAPAPED